MGKLSVVRVGLALGLLGGLFNAAWAALVWSGQAQGLLDSYFKLHFLSNPLELQAFSQVIAGQLVGLGFVGGLVMGLVFAVLWNLLFASSKPAVKKAAPRAPAAQAPAAAQ